MPRDDRAHGVYWTKRQKAGNKRRKQSRRNASGIRKLKAKGK